LSATLGSSSAWTFECFEVCGNLHAPAREDGSSHSGRKLAGLEGDITVRYYRALRLVNFLSASTSPLYHHRSSRHFVSQLIECVARFPQALNLLRRKLHIHAPARSTHVARFHRTLHGLLSEAYSFPSTTEKRKVINKYHSHFRLKRTDSTREAGLTRSYRPRRLTPISKQPNRRSLHERRRPLWPRYRESPVKSLS